MEETNKERMNLKNNSRGEVELRDSALILCAKAFTINSAVKLVNVSQLGYVRRCVLRDMDCTLILAASVLIRVNLTS